MSERLNRVAIHVATPDEYDRIASIATLSEGQTVTAEVGSERDRLWRQDYALISFAHALGGPDAARRQLYEVNHVPVLADNAKLGFTPRPGWVRGSGQREE